MLTQLLRKRTSDRRRIKFAETENKHREAGLRKSEAMRLRAGDGVQWGDHVLTRKCTFMRKGIVRRVLPSGDIEAERLTEADKPAGWLERVPYRFVAYRFQI